MKHITVVAPHHDDETFGCGGTLIQLIRDHKATVEIVVVLDGVSGVPCAQTDEEAKSIRKQELHEATQVLGVQKYRFLDLPDRGFVYSREALHTLIRVFREVQPRAIWFPHANDGDIEHKEVHRLVREAEWIAAGAYLQELGPSILPIEYLVCYEVWTPIVHPQVKVDITDVREQKQRAMSCYRSQLRCAAYDTAIMGLNAYRGSKTSETPCYVEAFEILKAPVTILF